MRKDFDNDASWRNSFNSMFAALHIQDCTPGKILEVMKGMPRTANKVQDITIAARGDNIRANDEVTLECLRTLYKDGKIEHRNIANLDFFMVKK